MKTTYLILAQDPNDPSQGLHISVKNRNKPVTEEQVLPVCREIVKDFLQTFNGIAVYLHNKGNFTWRDFAIACDMPWIKPLAITEINTNPCDVSPDWKPDFVVDINESLCDMPETMSLPVVNIIWNGDLPNKLDIPFQQLFTALDKSLIDQIRETNADKIRQLVCDYCNIHYGQVPTQFKIPTTITYKFQLEDTYDEPFWSQTYRDKDGNEIEGLCYHRKFTADIDIDLEQIVKPDFSDFWEAFERIYEVLDKARDNAEQAFECTLDSGGIPGEQIEYMSSECGARTDAVFDTLVTAMNTVPCVTVTNIQKPPRQVISTEDDDFVYTGQFPLPIET